MKNCLIQIPVGILLRTVFWTVLGTVCFASTPALAGGHYEDGIYIPDGVCVGDCSDTSSPSPVPSGPTQEQLRQQRERLRLKAKEWSSDEALDYVDRKDWDNAIRSFEEALDRDPDDPDLNDWLKRAKAEKAKARMPVVVSPPRAAPSNDSKIVDARNVPSGLPKSVENAIPHTPSGDRVRKGFQAIQDGDWKAALAWFQDAHNKEPGNPGLGRLVNLAQFTLEYRTRAKTPAVEKNFTPVQSPKQNITINPTGGEVAKSSDSVVEPGDGSLARAAAGQMAARARADAAFKQYVKKYGDRNAAGRANAVAKAARGEGYTDEELKAQLQKSLADYRKNYRKNHPHGSDDGVGGSPAAEEIILGGKG